MSLSKKLSGCSYCRNIQGCDWQSHKLKNEFNVVVCPTVIERNTCKYCKVYGHKVKDCPKLYEKKKREEAATINLDAFPALYAKAPKAPGAKPPVSVAHPVSFVGKVIKNRPTHIVAKLDKEHEDRKKAEIEEKKKKHEEWVKRQEEQAKQAEIDKKISAERHVQSMYDKYGTTWYRWVHMTPEDCDEAYDLRAQEYDQDIIREEAEREKSKKYDEYCAEMEATLTPDEYKWWLVDEHFEYLDREHGDETRFHEQASDAARYYYLINKFMLHDDDFVSDEWGAERKIDKVLRERKENEKK